MSNNAHHANLMREYYSARNAQETRCEEFSRAYDTETREFYHFVETRLTFKLWLIEKSRRCCNV